MRVLEATGVQSETRLAFAGLHQLLRPTLAALVALPTPQRAAILASFGMIEQAAPNLFLTALAALDLLSDAAAETPLLLIAEDAHWLDRSTVDVLLFLARRLELEPILLLAAVREGFDSPLEASGLPRAALRGLNRADAVALLGASTPATPASRREQVLAEASGNPLALVELSGAVERRGVGARAHGSLPPATRLTSAFAERILDLPADTRTALLIAAISDAPSLDEVLAASRTLLDPEVTLDVLAPATEARLIDVGDGEVRFRHPLVRSAIVQGAGESQRHEAHSALASLLADDPDRRAWHRAASSIAPNEQVAEELETAARRARSRGGTAVAVAGLERAARLSSDRAQRGRRLLRAAELGFELGDANLMRRLVAEAEPLQLGQLERAHLLWLRGVFDGRQVGGAERFDSMLDTVDELISLNEGDLALKFLWSAAIQCWWSDPAPSVGSRILAAAERLGAEEEDPRLIAVLAFASPRQRGRVAMERIAIVSGSKIEDADAARILGTAANAIGGFNGSSELLMTATAGLRAQGRLGLLARALTQQAWSNSQTIDLGVAIPAAEEGERLAEETGQPTIRYTATAVRSLLFALRGDVANANAAASDAEQFGLTVRSAALLALVGHARGVAAIADGNYEQAFAHLSKLHNPGDPTFHSFMRFLSAADLVDAAFHSERGEEIAPIIGELETLALEMAAPGLQAALSYARALLSDEREAEARFRAAELATAHWPFLWARTQLAFGEWLRRKRRPADARVPLNNALERFGVLGSQPWSQRAGRELRASGGKSRRRSPDARDELTTQELQIAQMAASGLTNREIGQALYLSHRTVSSHLYRTFPKLGITRRAELRGVLEQASGQAGR